MSTNVRPPDSEMTPTPSTQRQKEDMQAGGKSAVPTSVGASSDTFQNIQPEHSNLKMNETNNSNHSQTQTHVDVEQQEDGARPTFSIVQTKESEEKQRLESIYNDTIITPTPVEIYHRLTSLEERIVQLENTHPAWCAIHFNQPDRQFPPPPPITYVTRNATGDISVPRSSFGMQERP
ncbi:hypothetical protein K493DRAFT_320082 [Basidiobolus meristosporus CBS 931.73]|uniref:Uncharacterized protein n=1 Tax=Basidiobolus meristosporus CBS 931.73 TaxID=1314790 RepID=A0A1Y1XFU9_9FUNG|nr:hypothetical protein K493DRAFT_320082 [Basidiobolus meristosporus CBS 931.73]|eukprot:ORX84625.1 hypothetical protein K493DRAFT_320082 [Basidiobolus meristosporus CBS 931.73]